MSFPELLPHPGSGAGVTALAMLLQVPEAVRDTVVMIQATATGFAYWVDVIVSIATVILALAIIGAAVLAIVLAIPMMRKLQSVLKKLDRILTQVQTDVAPLVKHAHSAAENVNFISTSVRMDFEQLSQTVQAGNQQLVHAATLAEQRINEFNALMKVVQEEAETLFIDTASTIRGVQTGAETLRRLRSEETRDGAPRR